jgi:hypothetical protein
MATDSYKSTKAGDAEFKVRPGGSFGTDQTQPIMNGSKGGGTKGGVTNDQLKQLGRSMAKAAANGKGY